MEPALTSLLKSEATTPHGVKGLRRINFITSHQQQVSRRLDTMPESQTTMIQAVEKKVPISLTESESGGGVVPLRKGLATSFSSLLSNQGRKDAIAVRRWINALLFDQLLHVLILQ
jgi:hypothetical protein